MFSRKLTILNKTVSLKMRKKDFPHMNTISCVSIFWAHSTISQIESCIYTLYKLHILNMIKNHSKGDERILNQNDCHLNRWKCSTSTTFHFGNYLIRKQFLISSNARANRKKIFKSLMIIFKLSNFRQLHHSNLICIRITVLVEFHKFVLWS